MHLRGVGFGCARSASARDLERARRKNSPQRLKTQFSHPAAETQENGADDDTRGADEGSPPGACGCTPVGSTPRSRFPDAPRCIRAGSRVLDDGSFARSTRRRRIRGGQAGLGRVFSRPGARVEEPRFTLSDVARRVATPTTMITTGLLSESRRGRAGGFAPGSPCCSIGTGLPSRLEKAETSLAPQLWWRGPPAAVSGAVRCARAVAPVTRCVAGSRPSVWVARVVPSGEVRRLVRPYRIDRNVVSSLTRAL